MDLIFGAEDVTKNETSQVRQTSTSFISHPQWNVPVFANDIALVKLNPPVYETDYIKFINISSIKSNWTGETGVIAGWGSTSNDQEKVTPKLRYVNSTIMSNDECKNYDSEYKSILQPSMLCFAGTGIVGSCGGDSGGPLGVRGEQIGIISFGKADCTKGDPSVLTRLSEYISWLKDNSDINI